MRDRLVVVAILAALVTSGGYLGQSALSPGDTTPGPVLEAPEEIDFGLCNPGPVETRFTIRNPGQSPLELRDIRSGCGCAVLQRTGIETGSPLKHATVPPGESLELTVRVSLRPTDHARFRTTITLQTNDPNRPEWSVACVAHLAGSIRVSPAHWLVGNVATRVPQTIRVEIRDTGRPAPCRLVRAESSHPALVRVTSLEPRDEPPAFGRPGGGRLIAVADLEIVPPAQPGEFQAQVDFFEADGGPPAVTLPVSGRLLSRVEALPSGVLLPRSTGMGRSDSISVTVHSPTKEAFLLEVIEAAGLDVQVRTGPALAIHVIQAAWPLQIRPAAGQTMRRDVRLRARFPDRDVTVTVPVRYHTAGAAGDTR